MAKRKRKKITREMVRAYFGDEAEISWFCPWRVKTLTGGEVVISQRHIKTITATEDVHRAVMLLIGECWGKTTARGSQEFVLASVMHGEAAGVPVKPDYRNGNDGAGARQVAVFLFILVAGCAMGGASSSGALLFTLLVAFVVALAMGESEKEKARKKHEQMSFPYPRVYGSAGAARREDAKRRGWL
jgi:hypothetical protein